jgi:hypothetical protein
VPTITVFTPVHDSECTYLHELYDCLAELELQAEWQLEWMLQEDGRTGKPLRGLGSRPGRQFSKFWMVSRGP